MVFKDLSAPDHQPSVKKSNSVPVAFVADRFVALMLDFLIFSPVISLFTAGMVRETKTQFLLDAQSLDGALGALLTVLVVFCLVTFLQSLFLYFWQATPGQLFMQMRVISYPQSRHRLVYSQCLVRSLSWSFSFLFLALPFLEVLSHPLRRAFPDRASDTLVVTLKKDHDDGPVEMESRFISSWLRMSFLFLALIGVLVFFKAWQSLRNVNFGATTAQMSSCREIQGTSHSGVARLDAALALFLLDEISVECLEKEAEAALWGDPVNSQPLGYLAKYLVTEGQEQKEYYARSCEDRSTCTLARYLAEEGKAQDLELADSQLVVTQFLKSEEMYLAGDFAGSLKLIKELQKNSTLKEGLEKRYVRSVWALRESQDVSYKGRAPASVNVEEWIEDFKERYEVP